MDPNFSSCYQAELQYITAAMAGNFASQHPKIAKRFGMLDTGEVADPYLQRLLQNFSVSAARSQLRIERLADPVVQRTLQCIYPNYIAPQPSMAVVQFHPGYKSGQGMAGQLLPRGMSMTSRTSRETETACTFLTSQDVMIYPLEISRACWSGIPPDITDVHRHVFGNVQARSALRLRIRTTNGLPISALAGLDRLPIYLCGEPKIASRLFELINGSTLASVTGVPGEFATGMLHGVFQNGYRNGRLERAVDYEGLEPHQSLLHPVMPHLHGHNLMHEFMAFEPRFWFFALTDLSGGLSAIHGSEAEIVLLFSRELSALEQQVDASHFALFCSPAINLFPVRTEKLYIDPEHREHLITPDVDAPMNYEVHSVTRVEGHVEDQSKENGPQKPKKAQSQVFIFEPLDVALPCDERGDERYFTLRREADLPVDNVRRYRTRQTFTRTHTWISLLTHAHGVDDTGARNLVLDAWLTNGELPCLLPHNGRDDLIANGAKSVASVGFVRPPTMPKSPLARGNAAWQLIGQLNLEYDVFDDEFDEARPGEGLRQMLQPYLSTAAPDKSRQLDGLIGALAVPVSEFHQVMGDTQLTRGIEITLTFDESAFDGASPFTFALALERYVTRHVSCHSFTRTVLRTKQRGTVFTWTARDGTRGVF
jgi:type VI secretion system protein ImpG